MLGAHGERQENTVLITRLHTMVRPGDSFAAGLAQDKRRPLFLSMNRVFYANSQHPAPLTVQHGEETAALPGAHSWTGLGAVSPVRLLQN